MWKSNGVRAAVLLAGLVVWGSVSGGVWGGAVAFAQGIDQSTADTGGTDTAGESTPGGAIEAEYGAGDYGPGEYGPGDYGPGGYGEGDYGQYPGTPSYMEADCAGCGEISDAPRPSGRVLRGAGALYEHIVVGPQGQADAVRQAIEEVGGAVVRTRALAALSQVSQIATFPNRAAFERAQALIAERAPDSALALHHLYYFAQSGRAPRLYAPGLIGDPAPGHCRLPRAVSIGMIDGPVNLEHPALQGASVTYETVVEGHRVPSANHGTAVAALLVGEDASGALAGFARGARLHAVSVFGNSDAGEEASVERIVLALDRLAGRGVRLINMSISGPENPAMAQALAAVAGRGVVLVASSGNDRRPLVAWPAASEHVIAVTAIDAARRRFFRANTGAEIEFAAPGVDVYAARARGGGYVSGTSFATPIVTAIAARHMARGAGSAQAVRARLRAAVETLGAGQRNTEFGWGLVHAGGC
ncbi:S8 family serine peptidase [Pararhodobacter oceanensis]|uniref:S8 family serine peptidase n=1 Tax=Pararhodobacter oceanensis TaxID=2172121 RepID=UPI003A94D081